MAEPCPSITTNLTNHIIPAIGRVKDDFYHPAQG